jgi:hypothetical protein
MFFPPLHDDVLKLQELFLHVVGQELTDQEASELANRLLSIYIWKFYTKYDRDRKQWVYRTPDEAKEALRAHRVAQVVRNHPFLSRALCTWDRSERGVWLKRSIRHHACFSIRDESLHVE